MLGPPRLSKLLYEAYLLKLCFGDLRTVSRTESSVMSRRLLELIQTDADVRSHIIRSVSRSSSPTASRSCGARREDPALPRRGGVPGVTRQNMTRWAHDGWVDLRTKNMSLWKRRIGQLINEVEKLPTEETMLHGRLYNRRVTWD